VRRVPAERDRGVYTVTLDRLDAVGTYAMTASFTTNEKTRTVPGEADPAKMVYGRLVRGPAPRAQAVPLLQRSVTRYFVVTR
jgi:hypothetical protein